MNILSTNINQNSLSKNKYLPVSHNFSRNVFDTPKDTFVSSNPSFKCGEQKAAAQGTKILLELGTVLAAGFATYKSLVGDSKFNIKDFFKTLLGQQEELQEKIQKLEEENSRLKQENSELKANKENNSQTTQVSPQENEAGEAAPNTDTPQFVKFPPKRGVLSNEQKILKNTVIKLNISPEYNEKLTLICKDILKKGSKDPENKTRTLNLASELEACNGDIEKLKSVIDKFEIKDSTDNGIVSSSNEGNENDNQVQNESDNSTENKSGIKIVGKIDLSQVPDRKKSRARISEQNQDDTSANAASNDNNSAQPSTDEKSFDTTLIPSEDVSGTYTFSLPGTVNQGTKVNLTSLLFNFEQRYIADKKEEANINGTKPEYIKWMYRRPVGRVNANDVINEVAKCKTHGIRSRYKSINRTNAEEIANVINEEKRFKELFTFHGSTKFIERFIDFDSDVPIDTQVSNVMDVFQSTMKLAMKYGVEIEEHDDVFVHKDNYGNETTELRKGANVTIPTECYTSEARKIFGTYPIKLGICRSGAYDRKAIICTIYPKGVY